MTVNELRAALRVLSLDGHGDCKIYVRTSHDDEEYSADEVLGVDIDLNVIFIAAGAA